ncbi:hypothetical protein [Nonomuraea wenchangensis]|uniref:hypothetical protein n=1 Tax=Nonomuraea wenchangensis TaxID=568860 RepID=UPI00343D9FB7
MRTWFQPEESDDFEAAKDLLVRRCLVWADEHGRQADGLLLETAVDSRHQSLDGRLAYWDRAQIRRFLLRWVPYYVTAPREVLATAPGTLRTYLHYLDATGLRDPRGATLPDAESAIDEAAAEFETALDDPTRQGLATFWARTALDQGYDLTVPGAFERFKRDLDNGRISFDQDVLDAIMQARLAGTVLDEERAPAQPPISLPPADELAGAAERSRVVRHLAALADWLGKDGRPLTKAGNLSLADARELAALLGTGEDELKVRTSADLPHLSLLLAWARQARVTRVSKGRLLRVAKAAPLLRDPAALWQRAFDVLPELGGMVTTPVATWRPVFLLAEVFPEVLPDLLNTLYGMADVPVPRLAETVWLSCQGYFLIEEDRADLWRAELERDLLRAFQALADLGAVELRSGPADPLYSSDLDLENQLLPPDAVARLRARLAEPGLTLATLTPLGHRAVRDRLLAEGRDAPLIGELAAAPAPEFLGTLAQHYPLEAAAQELAAWLSRPGHDVDTLLQAVTSCPFRVRAAAMLTVSAELLPDVRALLPTLRHDPALGPAVLNHLVERNELGPDTLDPHEHLLLGAENFLMLLETAGPETVAEQVRAIAGKEAPELLEAVLSSGHPDEAGLAELRALVAEPLRARSARHPLRLAPTTAPGARGRRTKRKR